MQKKSKINEYATIAEADISRLVEGIKFNNSSTGINYGFTWLSQAHIRLAMYSYYVKQEIKAFKEHLHVAMQLKLAAISIDDYQRFTNGYEIFYSVLSDNPALIERVSKFSPKYFVEGSANPLNSSFFVHMLQLAILGDYEALQKKIDRLAKNGRKRDRTLPAQGKDFFSLLIRGDKEGLEGLIAQQAIFEEGDPLTEDLMCFPGTVQAKICWLKGIEVQIDNPLLPMELMPVAPLERYDDIYEFLSPDYVAPKVGLIERLRYRLRRHAENRAQKKRFLKDERSR